MYDKADPISIFNYAVPLIGHTLREVVGDDVIKNFDSRNKGGLGQMVEELYYHYKPNSKPEPDFNEAGVELKTTGLKQLKNFTLQIKERLVIDMINYNEVVNQTFEMSLFYKKFRLMLLLFYLWEKDRQMFDYYFLYIALWEVPEKDLLIIKHDYDVIVDKIRRGEAHLLSEGDTEYLGACRKGHKGDKLHRQPYSDVEAPGRAFSLKPAYMRTVLEYIKRSKKSAVVNCRSRSGELQVFRAEELKDSSFEEALLQRISPYQGLSYRQLCAALGTSFDTSKDKYALIANRIILGRPGKVNLTEEFKKAGLQLKTIRVEADGGIHESMSFENINYFEVCDNEDWYESRLYEIFSGRFLFAVFRANGDKIQYRNKHGVLIEENSYSFERAFFWTMSVADLELAEKYWLHIRECVRENKIAPQYFNAHKNKRFHVRPKAQNAKDKALSPHGGFVKKYCYWFNNSYVKEIVESNVQNE